MTNYKQRQPLSDFFLFVIFLVLTIGMADTAYVTVNVEETGLNLPGDKGCCCCCGSRTQCRERLGLIRMILYIICIDLPCIALCHAAHCDTCILPCFRDGNCCDQDRCCGCGPVYPS